MKKLLSIVLNFVLASIIATEVIYALFVFFVVIPFNKNFALITNAAATPITDIQQGLNESPVPIFDQTVSGDVINVFGQGFQINGEYTSRSQEGSSITVLYDDGKDNSRVLTATLIQDDLTGAMSEYMNGKPDELYSNPNISASTDDTVAYRSSFQGANYAVLFNNVSSMYTDVVCANNTTIIVNSDTPALLTDKMMTKHYKDVKTVVDTQHTRNTYEALAIENKRRQIYESMQNDEDTISVNSSDIITSTSTVYDDSTTDYNDSTSQAERNKIAMADKIEYDIDGKPKNGAVNVITINAKSDALTSHMLVFDDNKKDQVIHINGLDLYNFEVKTSSPTLQKGEVSFTCAVKNTTNKARPFVIMAILVDKNYNVLGKVVFTEYQTKAIKPNEVVQLSTKIIETNLDSVNLYSMGGIELVGI